jgi:hypothetical protein
VLSLRCSWPRSTFGADPRRAVKRATPPCRILTAARLDREAELDRDLAAVASALHHDAGLLVDAAITRARETFRPGETVREWWDRARTIR